MFPLLTEIGVELFLRPPHLPTYDRQVSDCHTQHVCTRETDGNGNSSCFQYFQRPLERGRQLKYMENI